MDPEFLNMCIMVSALVCQPIGKRPSHFKHVQNQLCNHFVAALYCGAVEFDHIIKTRKKRVQADDEAQAEAVYQFSNQHFILNTQLYIAFDNILHLNKTH